MKKLFLFSLLSIIFISCKEEDPPPPPNEIKVERERNPLILMEYSSKSSAAGGIEVFRKTVEAKFKNQLAMMTTVSDPSDPLYTVVSDSLHSNFNEPSIFSFVVDNEETSIVDLSDNIELLINTEKPFLGLTHTVSENDTAYLVDVKVKFFKDTVSDLIYIETYQLANIDAKTYKGGTLDLRQSPDGTLLVNTQEETKWNKDIETGSIDTSFESTILFNQGDQYVHDYIVLRNFDKTNVFGRRLSTYTKFGPEFYLGDQIGLKQNPIRHHFLKESYLTKNQRVDFDYKAEFVTVVYFFNSLERKYEVINAYMD